jgi:hypothetical protein
MSVYARRNYDDGQVLFNRILFAFTITIKIVLKIIVYSPLLFTGWFIARQILGADANIILWITLMLVFAVLTYFIMYFSKGVLIALKYNHNLFWIPLFIVCVLFTCLFPVWIVFEPLTKFIGRYTQTNQELLTWIFVSAFGLYVYSKYHFLTNIAPAIAYPYYQRGINITMHSLNLSNSFKAKKSQEIL